tara:strand:- start:1697 stop:2692 length:996 start_codon:yes stop_codon:yes gene_type:complete
MFDGDGVRIKKSSSDIFTDFKILDLDRTPQGFGENTTDYFHTYSWLLSEITQTDKKKIIICKKGEVFGIDVFKTEILNPLLENCHDKEIVLVFNDYQEFDLPVKLVYDLSWWSDVLIQNINHLDEIENIGNNKRTKIFLSRNNKEKDFRVEWIDYLKRNNLKKDGYVSEVWNKVYIEKKLPDDIIIDNEINFNWTYNNDINLINNYNDVFCEVVIESEYNVPIYGFWTSEKSWRPFLFCVIPMIISFKNWDYYLKDAGFDLFDDVIDTSFYHTDNLQKKFSIIKDNFEIIKNDLTIESKFKDDIFLRLKKNQSHFLNHDNYVNYLKEKIYG